jgi:transcription termination/antitermination protein NusA
MTRFKIDADLMKLITLFESMTGAKVKDCIMNDKVTFIVEEGEMGKAIGKNGVNIRKLENALKKRVKLIEHSSDVLRFVGNVIYPIKPNDIKHEDEIITIYGKDTSSKAMLIGRERQNINQIKELVKRYFDVKEIKVE